MILSKINFLELLIFRPEAQYWKGYFTGDNTNSKALLARNASYFRASVAPYLGISCSIWLPAPTEPRCLRTENEKRTRSNYSSGRAHTFPCKWVCGLFFGSAIRGRLRGSSWGLNALPHDSAALRANKYKQA